MIDRSKAAYVLRVLRHRIQRQPRRCPYCGPSTALKMLGRKKLIQEVIECENCRLIFRYPQETAAEASAYYHDDYSSGLASEIPDDDTLERWKRTGFEGTSLDVRAKIQVLRELTPARRVLDFGASWGYGTYQLIDAGFDATAFEVSRPRASFGRERLGVEIHDDPGFLERLPDASFDIVFSNHVLEHLGIGLRENLEQLSRVLRPGGIAFHVLPNFTGSTARAGAFWSWIGEAHPLAPTRAFFENVMPDHGFDRTVVCSGPFDEHLVRAVREQRWDETPQEGDELLVIGWRRATPR